MKKISNLNIIKRAELFKILRISITHHSNAMEGTTLNYKETQELLTNNKTADNKDINEQLIILGFADAYDIIVREANNKNTTLDSAFIKDLHTVMFSRLSHSESNFIVKPIGAYRINESKIKGIDIKLSLPHLISQQIENLLYRFQKCDMSIEEIGCFHAKFENIHPFADGNGRIGRLIMAFQCIKNDIVPPLIKLENRNEYLNNIYLAQKQKNYKPLGDFLSKCQNQSLEIMYKSFEKKTNEKIKSKNQPKQKSNNTYRSK